MKKDLEYGTQTSSNAIEIPNVFKSFTRISLVEAKVDGSKTTLIGYDQNSKLSTMTYDVLSDKEFAFCLSDLRQSELTGSIKLEMYKDKVRVEGSVGCQPFSSVFDRTTKGLNTSRGWDADVPAFCLLKEWTGIQEVIEVRLDQVIDSLSGNAAGPQAKKPAKCHRKRFKVAMKIIQCVATALVSCDTDGIDKGLEEAEEACK